MDRLLRAPALHFVLAGAVLFGVRTWWQVPSPSGAASIAITADDVSDLRTAWIEEHGAPPDAGTEDALIEAMVDEEVLHREALAVGLDRRDRLVRSRLADLGRFLGDVTEDGAEAEREARRLGMAARDVVVRRHLVSLMRLALARGGAAEPPTDAELEAVLAAQAERFRQPAQLRLSHVFLSRDRHGATLARDAARLLARVRAARTAPDAAAALGDPFLRGAHLAAASDADLDRIFGPGFAATLRDAPLAAWSGPVASSYGLHLVWIHERIPPRLPALEDARAQLAHRLLDARARERLRARLDALRARYEITIAR